MSGRVTEADITPFRATCTFVFLLESGRRGAYGRKSKY